MFVPGEPVLLLTPRERSWQDQVRATGVNGLSEVALRFVVSSWRRGGQRFDLDNLVDPVLAVVAARPAERKSVWATVELGTAPGVTIGGARPPPAPPDATRVTIANPPLKSVRSEVALAELADLHQLVGEDAVGCSIAFGRDCGPMVFGFEGPVKPTLDALWPILGGGPHRPSDHRIRDLRVVVDIETAGANLAVWPLPDSGV